VISVDNCCKSLIRNCDCPECWVSIESLSIQIESIQSKKKNKFILEVDLFSEMIKTISRISLDWNSLVPFVNFFLILAKHTTLIHIQR